MCGGHKEEEKAPEGEMSRVIATMNEIQPCKYFCLAAFL